MYVQTLLFIIEHKTKIEYQDLDQLILNENLFSINEVSDTLQVNLMQQICCDWLIKIHHVSHYFVFSSLSLILKKNDCWCCIHHLSYLKEKPVNCNILKNWNSIEYFIFDQTIIALYDIDRNAMLIKRDLVNIFHHVLVITLNHWLFKFSWEDEYWIDCFLLFNLQKHHRIYLIFSSKIFAECS